jgi:putative flippase GtrA
LIKKEIKMFIVIGICTVIIDYLTYSSILTYTALNKEKAKGLGFVAGTLFAYFGNRSLTFSKKTHRKKSFMYFSTLYLMTLFLNILINSFVLKIIGESYLGYKIAFLIATAFSATLNFFGMKFFVFKSIRD